MKKKKSSMKYVDAMAIKDGYIATPISYEQLSKCNDDRLIKKGDYEMEGYGEEEDSEEEMD